MAFASEFINHLGSFGRDAAVDGVQPVAGFCAERERIYVYSLSYSRSAFSVLSIRDSVGESFSFNFSFSLTKRTISKWIKRSTISPKINLSTTDNNSRQNLLRPKARTIFAENLKILRQYSVFPIAGIIYCAAP